MKQLPVSVDHPEGGGLPPDLLAKVIREIDGVSQELEASGARVFAGGLHRSGTASVVQLEDGEIRTLVTDRNATDEFGEAVPSNPLNPTDRKERNS